MDNQSKSTFSSIAPLEHEYYVTLWKLVKLGELENLDGRRKILGQLMVEHSQYQYFWEIPYAFAETELQKAIEQEGVNPDLHLTIEAIILEQVKNGDPPETGKAYAALVKAGVEPHEARHTVGRVLSEAIWKISRIAEKGHQPDEDMYIRELNRLARHPLKVLNEQTKKLRKRL